MSHNVILEALSSTPAYRQLRESLPGAGETYILGGAVGSVGPVVTGALHRDLEDRLLIVVASDPTEATAVEADLQSLLGERESALFPQRETLPYESRERHVEISGLRVEAAEALLSGRSRVLVTTLRALQERTPVPAGLAELRLTLAQGDEPGFSRLRELLRDRGFEEVPLVEEVGQFAVRGGIIDLFSFGSPDPVRIEFWGDEISSMRRFDILDQRSTGEVREIHVLPVDFLASGRSRSGSGNGNGPSTDAPRSLLELVPSDAILLWAGTEDPDAELRRTWEHVNRLHDEMVSDGREVPAAGELFLDPPSCRSLLERHPRVRFQPGHEGDGVLDSGPPPEIDRDMDRLRAVLREASGKGGRTLLLCDNQGQAQRLEEILGGPGALPRGAQVAIGSLAGGFILASSEPPTTVLTDHEIFRRSRRLRRGRRFRGAVSLERLAQLKPGEYVVHMDHGIGRFRGLERVDVAGEELEALALEYADGEILRVPTHRLDLVERWVGASEDTEPPSVHRIGGKRWERLRNKTEAAIEQMTAELLTLYARRENADGYAFSPDTRWQKEMESSFLYEDTPDQRTATEDVKRDMEAAMPMDRLICGDVGYGKTEVAIRAAFKAVQDSKQVAVLAPTTILVEQHRHTFEERLADYPVRIAALSRFRTRKEQEEILEDLAAGELDLVIGTHRLLQEDVEFHDLGLLIVDEEQRFGVRHKERLKKLRTAVDVLTLTATPIPRTLHLSLSGLRDLTLIRTPPRDRMPIITHVLRWNDRIVMEALERELDRGGQAFFLHNRVQTIHTAAARVRRLLPEARVDVAHGQMTAGELDEAMRAFVDSETDVLVCTSIIENGLDVPNANTLIVDRADRFGLSQLYQIRGRVGRSDRRAYCYLVVPENLTEDAEQRMKVLEHYTELGSGYEVALRDLELRGAGNLLGSDQSGFAHAVGLDTYMRLLEKTVERLNRDEDDAAHPDPDVSLGGSGYLPDDYVADSAQKLHLYRRISKVRHRSEVEELRSELVDRYGPLPEQAARLVDAATLRVLGRELGIQRIIVREDQARLNFRGGVVPQMSLLQRPLESRQLRVEVRRMDPFSITVTPGGPEPLAETLIRALNVLVRRTAEAAA